MNKSISLKSQQYTKKGRDFEGENKFRKQLIKQGGKLKSSPNYFKCKWIKYSNREVQTYRIKWTKNKFQQHTLEETDFIFKYIQRLNRKGWQRMLHENFICQRVEKTIYKGQNRTSVKTCRREQSQPTMMKGSVFKKM